MEDFRLLRSSRFLVTSLDCRLLPCWARPLAESLIVPKKLVNDGAVSSIPTREDELLALIFRLIEDDVLWLVMVMVMVFESRYVALSLPSTYLIG